MKKLCAMLVILSTVVLAQTNNDDQNNISSLPDTQQNFLSKHSIDLKVSFWNSSESAVSVGFHGYSVETGTGGISGEIMYNFYPNSIYSFNASVGVKNTEVKVENFSTYTSTVVPIMMGMKYYFIEYSLNNPFRPFVGVSIGGLIGTETGVEILNVGTHTETAVGASVGMGSDIILGSLVKLQAEISYNLYTDFKEEIGGNKNYSGPEFSLGIGFMF
jgi:hypothetical protein